MGEPKGPGQFSQQPEEIVAQKAREELHTREVVLDVLKKLSQKYNVDISKLTSLRYSELPKVIEQFGGIDNLKGKRILDIGCGAVESKEKNSRVLEPWLCRALKELDADPVGVDIRDLSQEEFEHHELDLSKPEALDIFPDKSFDAVNVNSFFDSNIFEKSIRVQLGFAGESDSFDEDEKVEDEIQTLKKKIGIHIKRLLNDNGKLLIVKDVIGNDLRSELGL